MRLRAFTFYGTRLSVIILRLNTFYILLKTNVRVFYAFAVILYFFTGI